MTIILLSDWIRELRNRSEVKKSIHDFDNITTVVDDYDLQILEMGFEKLYKRFARGATKYPKHVLYDALLEGDFWKKYSGLTDEQSKKINEILVNAVLEGIYTKPELVAKRIVKEVGIPERRAMLIARTELAHIANKARELAYKKLTKVEKFVWVTERDGKVCDKCKKMAELTKNGVTLDEIKKLLKQVAPDTARELLVHPGCRCSIYRYYDDKRRVRWWEKAEVPPERRLYISPEDVPKYQQAGVTVYRGKRGGLYIDKLEAKQKGVGIEEEEGRKRKKVDKRIERLSNEIKRLGLEGRAKSALEKLFSNDDEKTMEGYYELRGILRKLRKEGALDWRDRNKMYGRLREYFRDKFGFDPASKKVKERKVVERNEEEQRADKVKEEQIESGNIDVLIQGIMNDYDNVDKIIFDKDNYKFPFIDYFFEYEGYDEYNFKAFDLNEMPEDIRRSIVAMSMPLIVTNKNMKVKNITVEAYKFEHIGRAELNVIIEFENGFKSKMFVKMYKGGLLGDVLYYVDENDKNPIEIWGEELFENPRILKNFVDEVSEIGDKVFDDEYSIELNNIVINSGTVKEGEYNVPMYDAFWKNTLKEVWRRSNYTKRMKIALILKSIERMDKSKEISRFISELDDVRKLKDKSIEVFGVYANRRIAFDLDKSGTMFSKSVISTDFFKTVLLQIAFWDLFDKKINYKFESQSKVIEEFSGEGEVYAFHSKMKIVFPYDSTYLHEFGDELFDVTVGVLWHEFQHSLYHNLHYGDETFNKVSEMAYRLAHKGALTEYAKTNENEALSELFMVLYAGKLDMNDNYVRQILKGYGDVIERLMRGGAEE